MRRRTAGPRSTPVRSAAVPRARPRPSACRARRPDRRAPSRRRSSTRVCAGPRGFKVSFRRCTSFDAQCQFKCAAITPRTRPESSMTGAEKSPSSGVPPARGVPSIAPIQGPFSPCENQGFPLTLLPTREAFLRGEHRAAGVGRGDPAKIRIRRGQVLENLRGSAEGPRRHAVRPGARSSPGPNPRPAGRFREPICARAAAGRFRAPPDPPRSTPRWQSSPPERSSAR